MEREFTAVELKIIEDWEEFLKTKIFVLPTKLNGNDEDKKSLTEIPFKGTIMELVR